MNKKKILLLAIFALICTFAFQCNAFATLDGCPSKLDIDKKIPDTVSLIIKIIFIVVPILLVVLGSMDLLKGVIAQKEDEIKKGQQTFIKRLIAGVLVFFVYAIVKLLISAVAGDDKDSVLQCACYFINGTNSSSCSISSENND